MNSTLISKSVQFAVHIIASLLGLTLHLAEFAMNKDSSKFSAFFSDNFYNISALSELPFSFFVHLVNFVVRRVWRVFCFVPRLQSFNYHPDSILGSEFYFGWGWKDFSFVSGHTYRSQIVFSVTATTLVKTWGLNLKSKFCYTGLWMGIQRNLLLFRQLWIY